MSSGWITERDRGLAAVLSVLLPGLGHAYQQRWGTACACFAAWLVLAYMLFVYLSLHSGDKGALAIVFVQFCFLVLVVRDAVTFRG